MRPQHITPAAGTAGPRDTRATVVSVDPLGEEMHVIFRTASNLHAIVRTKNGDEIRAGREISVWINPAEVHVFENSGERAAITRR